MDRLAAPKRLVYKLEGLLVDITDPLNPQGARRRGKKIMRPFSHQPNCNYLGNFGKI